jgi:glycosyltransferase involved in cell wall biosynthesis
MAQIGQTPVVFDVHEDTRASISLKSWLPDYLSDAARSVIDRLEKRADEKATVILAEASYQERFSPDAVVVPNSTWVPKKVTKPGVKRVVYLGSLTYARGASTLIAVAGALKTWSIQMDVIGSADARTTALLRKAAARGDLTWHDFVPNDEALLMLEGALAGLCLLRDEANYRYSLPTKIVEYMAHGVPVITTALPVARDVVTKAGAGEVVAFDDPAAVMRAIARLRDNKSWREQCGKNGHAFANSSLNWANDSVKFVKTLEKAAAGW